VKNKNSKGGNEMVIILVFLTIFVAISIEVLRSRKARKAEAGIALETAIPSTVISFSQRRNHLQFPKDFYYHNGHAWAKLEEKDVVKLGLDDLTQKVIGKVEAIEIPPVGDSISQGKVAWKLYHGKRKLGQLSPLGGRVIEVNEKLKEDPSLINQSPYEEGWILKIKPNNLGEELPELMDSLQMKIHFDQVKAKLRSSLEHESLGTVYGDGEEIITNASDKLDEKWWRILVTQLFHSSPEN